MKTIFITDVNGMPVLRYIVVMQHDMVTFYGGNAHPGVQLDQGPHVVHLPDTLLDLLARLANEDGHPYSMTSNLSSSTVHLQPEMMADEIAAVLGIDVGTVLARYSLLVRPPA